MSERIETRARNQSRLVNFLILVLEIVAAFVAKIVRLFYDAEARSARLARLSRRLALLEGGALRRSGSNALSDSGSGGGAPGANSTKLQRVQKIKILVNPISGRGMGMKAIPHLTRALRELGYEVEIVVTERAGQARQACWALEPNAKAVIAVGGDGTLNEVVNGIGDQGVPVALYAAGTGNCLAKEFRIPRNPELFCRMVAEGRTVSLDVGEVKGVRRFHSFAGVGFDARVVEELSKHRTGAIVMSQYTAPILKALRDYNWPAIRVEVDGEEICRKAGLVIVSNIKSYAVMEVAGAASPMDGQLDVCIFQKRSWLAMFRYAFGAFTRTHTNDRDVIYVQGKVVRLAADRPGVPIQVDGDSAGELPVELRAVPATVKFVVPAEVAAAAAPRAAAVLPTCLA